MEYYLQDLNGWRLPCIEGDCDAQDLQDSDHKLPGLDMRDHTELRSKTPHISSPKCLELDASTTLQCGCVPRNYLHRDLDDHAGAEEALRHQIEVELVLDS